MHGASTREQEITTNQQLAKIIELLKQRIEPVEIEGGVLDFSYELDPDEETTLEEKMPWNGYVMSAIINWPSGCSNLAGVRITVDDLRVVPRNAQWIALNDVTIEVPISRKIQKDRLIVVDMKNNDTTFTHYLTVLITVYNYFPGFVQLGVL